MRLIDSGLSILSNIAGAINFSVRVAHDGLNGSNFDSLGENNNLDWKMVRGQHDNETSQCYNHSRRVLCFEEHRCIVWESRLPQWHYWASIGGEVVEKQWRRKYFCHSQPHPE